MSGPDGTFPPAEDGQDYLISNGNVNLGPTLDGDNEMSNPNVEDLSRSKKRRKLKSKVWDEFTKTEGEDGKEWARCKHCKKEFVGSSKSGTTHLKNHLDRCQSKRHPGGSGSSNKLACHQSGDCFNVIKGKSKVDDQESSNELDVTRMIITYYGSSLVSIRDDILIVFEEEKEKLSRYFDKFSSCFNLLIEYSDDMAVRVSVHFIDDNWKLKIFLSILLENMIFVMSRICMKK